MGWAVVFWSPGNRALVNSGTGRPGRRGTRVLVSDWPSLPRTQHTGLLRAGSQSYPAPSRPLGPATCVPTTTLCSRARASWLPSIIPSTSRRPQPSQVGTCLSSDLLPLHLPPPTPGQAQERPWGTGAGTAPGRRGRGGTHTLMFGQLGELSPRGDLSALGSPNPKGQLSPCRAGRAPQPPLACGPCPSPAPLSFSALDSGFLLAPQILGVQLGPCPPGL